MGEKCDKKQTHINWPFSVAALSFKQQASEKQLIYVNQTTV